MINFIEDNNTIIAMDDDGGVEVIAIATETRIATMIVEILDNHFCKQNDIIAEMDSFDGICVSDIMMKSYEDTKNE